ncbi:uncharacterized protein LOC108157755 [Drosophila miranda]|uniref:uncharacterized protein LOC108157755 n=1 Tax=Drosophila miranda TaxID=7229 RepID=UPI0007E60333|nr:uncharacterized protein LOC108157755 [Drosophila miranda]
MNKNMKEIELHCRRQWMPQYEAIPKEIWNLLLFRFYVATLLCIYLDLFFLLYSFCQSYLLGVLEDTFVSTVLLVIVQPGVVAYGLLLCHNHNKPPIYYQRRIQRLLMEIPLKLLLLGIVLYVSIFTNWMYARFITDIFDDRLDFLLIHGCCCGIAYFLAERGRCLRRFSLPGKDGGLDIWQSIIQNTCNSRKVGLVVGTALASGLIQSSWGAGKMFWALVLTTLVLTKLHMIKNIYEIIMQKELPLTLIPRVHLGDNERLWDPVVLWICRQNLWPMPEEMIELQLSFHMALDTKCLYGLHLLAAHEFHVSAARKCDFLCPTLFSRDKINTISWQELREVIMGMVDEFVANMKSAIEDTTSPDQLFQRNAKDKPRKEGMRKLSATLPVKTTPKCLPSHDHLIQRKQTQKVRRTGASLCQPIKRCSKCGRPSVPIDGFHLQKNKMCRCCNVTQKLRIWFRCIWECQSQMLSTWSRPIWECLHPAWIHYFFDTDPIAKINHALRCAEHLDDVLRGLVRICIRSLREDKYGLIQSDLMRFLNALVLVEKQLNAAQNMKIVRNGRLCGTHHKLLVGIKHCMFYMLDHFSPYLDDIVQGDEQMLKILKCWMEKLGIPHTHLP